MKKTKIIIVLFFTLFIINLVNAYDFQTNCEEKLFVVTAYYSPKSGQAFYYKDTFEAEKALNGEGLHGASGKPVFNGMLAAPSSYDFGGLLYFPSLGGVGEIADRGGAIVHAGEQGHSYDRIDVWMGEGELGLVKALVFGKQTITGYYCDAAIVKEKGIKAKIGFNFDLIPIQKYFFDSTLFLQELKYDRTDVWVYKLQDYLMKFGYMNKKTGYFGSETKNALCKYQIARGISSWKYCGTFGSNTRYYMKNEAKKRGFLPDFSETTTIDDLIYYSKNYEFKSNVTMNKNNTVSSGVISEGSNKDSSATPQNDMQPKIINYFTEPYNNGTQNSKIGDLQDMLRHYGFYEGNLTNTYDKKTLNAVHNFQVAMGILKADDKTSAARGWLGPSTRKALNEKRTEFQEFKKNEELKMKN